MCGWGARGAGGGHFVLWRCICFFTVENFLVVGWEWWFSVGILVVISYIVRRTRLESGWTFGDKVVYCLSGHERGRDWLGNRWVMRVNHILYLVNHNSRKGLCDACIVGIMPISFLFWIANRTRVQDDCVLPKFLLTSGRIWRDKTGSSTGTSD